jgi:hypothetical protein
MKVDAAELKELFVRSASKAKEEFETKPQIRPTDDDKKLN